MQQLVPFANVCLGISGGAIDNRPLARLDWLIRLPCVLAALYWTSPRVLVAAHITSLLFFGASLPFVWDHMCWSACTEMCFLITYLCCDSSCWVKSFCAAARAQTVILYFCAAFWKLTTSFLDPTTSCGTLLTAELIFALVPEKVLPSHSGLARLLVRAGPLLTVVGEFAISLFLAFFVHIGVGLALVFHLLIMLLPVNAAGGFSICCASRLFVFLPDATTEALGILRKSATLSAMALATLAIACALLQGTSDATFATYLGLMALYIGAMSIHFKGNTLRAMSEMPSTRVRMLAGFAALFYGLVPPILGLQSMGALTMYSNMKYIGGSNHLLAPTFVLQDYHEELARLTDWPWLVDAFGGGLVRVDATNSKAIREVNPADASFLEPPRVRALLANSGHQGKYFAQYYARMKTSDFLDGLLGNETDEATPFVLHAFELRRLLAAARARRERFFLNYTRLPGKIGTPAMWREHHGPQVNLEEDASAGLTHCTMDGLGKCEAGEVALLSPPPHWLARFLLPYTIPLVTGDTNSDIHCIS